MRPRTAGVVWAAALALGSLAGAYLVPGGSGGTPAPIPTATPTDVLRPTAPATGGPAPSTAPAATPTATPTASPSPSPSMSKKLTEDDLLSVRSFADQSVSVTYESQHGQITTGVDATACVDDDVHKTGTLKKLTGYDPTLEGDWTQTDTGEGVRQVVAVADDADEARKSLTRIVVAMQACQEAVPGHFVLGLADTFTYSPARSASWVGRFTGEQNTTGRAPQDAQPCGGTVLARNGARFTVVNVYMCLDGAQLAGLADAASERLG